MIRIDTIPSTPLSQHPFIDKELTVNIQKDCKLLTTITTTNNKDITLYNFRHHTLIIGVIGKIVVYVLQLQQVNQPVLDGIKAIQVNKTNISTKYERLGITSSVYKALVDDNQTCLLSNVIQTNAMAELWVKFAKDSVTSDYKVLIFESTGLLKDTNDIPVCYDGINVADDVIWCDTTTRNKTDTFFVLQKTVTQAV